MKALTLIQPWAWAILNGKPVENRTWAFPERLRGQIIALHAGQKHDDEAAEWISRTFGLQVPARADMAHGAIVGTARLLGVTTSGSELSPAQRRWFFGPFGFLLGDVVACEPLSCPGALGLWEVPPSALEHLVPLDPEAADRQADAYWRGRAAP